MFPPSTESGILAQMGIRGIARYIRCLAREDHLRIPIRLEQVDDGFATVAQLTTRLDEQAAQIQKVSAQLEASKPAPQVVLNNQ
jgi:hypothetical protein